MKYFEVRSLRDKKSITSPEKLIYCGLTNFVLKFSLNSGSLKSFIIRFLDNTIIVRVSRKPSIFNLQ